MSGRCVYLRLRSFAINESSTFCSLTKKGLEDGSCEGVMLEDVVWWDL